MKKLFGKSDFIYEAGFCEGSHECEGLPEKTRNFYVIANVPYGLKIVKENGELKILNFIQTSN